MIFIVGDVPELGAEGLTAALALRGISARHIPRERDESNQDALRRAISEAATDDTFLCLAERANNVDDPLSMQSDWFTDLIELLKEYT